MSERYKEPKRMLDILREKFGTGGIEPSQDPAPIPIGARHTALLQGLGAMSEQECRDMADALDELGEKSLAEVAKEFIRDSFSASK